MTVITLAVVVASVSQAVEQPVADIDPDAIEYLDGAIANLTARIANTTDPDELEMLQLRLDKLLVLIDTIRLAEVANKAPESEREERLQELEGAIAELHERIDADRGTHTVIIPDMIASGLSTLDEAWDQYSYGNETRNLYDSVLLDCYIRISQDAFQDHANTGEASFDLNCRYDSKLIKTSYSDNTTSEVLKPHTHNVRLDLHNIPACLIEIIYFNNTQGTNAISFSGHCWHHVDGQPITGTAYMPPHLDALGQEGAILGQEMGDSYQRYTEIRKELNAYGMADEQQWERSFQYWHYATLPPEPECGVDICEDEPPEQ